MNLACHSNGDIYVKTFTSKRHGFQIDIPDHWSCPPTGFFARLLASDANPEFKRTPRESMNFEIGPLSPEPPLEETTEAFLEYAGYVGHRDVRPGRILVAGREHFCAVYRAKEGVWLKKYALVFDGTEYAITCTLGSDQAKVEETESVYDEVVRSFRLP